MVEIYSSFLTYFLIFYVLFLTVYIYFKLLLLNPIKVNFTFSLAHEGFLHSNNALFMILESVGLSLAKLENAPVSSPLPTHSFFLLFYNISYSLCFFLSCYLSLFCIFFYYLFNFRKDMPECADVGAPVLFVEHTHHTYHQTLHHASHQSNLQDLWFCWYPM
jgi:hypothetical protein